MQPPSADEHWDFYSCEIDDRPHLTMVNLALYESAPIHGLNHFYCIELSLRHPNPDTGMPTNEEFEPLNQIEDLIDVNRDKKLIYIARQTGDGKRKLYFYGSADAGITALYDKISQSFPEYEKDNFSFEDAAWETYFENLYPNAIAMNEIKNRRVLEALEESGDDLSVPREIDHMVIFQSKKSAKEFEKIVRAKGFTVEITKSGILRKTFSLLVQKVDRPSGLDPVTFELEQLAQDLGGVYDGWGCVVAT